MRALRWLIREWRGGELALLAVSLILAVAIVTGISAFADRLNRGITQESHRFLAADRVLVSPRPVPEEWLQKAAALGLRQAQTVDFRSMIYAGDEMQLAAVKAVSDAYPLKGALQISDEAFAEPRVVREGPRAGESWMDSRLFPLLGVTAGDKIGLGEISLTASAAVASEPDRANLYGLGPRVMINLADLDASGVVQPGSLVQYRYLFAGEEAVLSAFGQWLQPRLERGLRWQRLEDSQPQMARTLERAERYLLLAGSFGVALAAVAVALAARRYSERHYDAVALMKALGASGGQVLRLYLGNLALLSLVTVVLGAGLGWLFQIGLVTVIRDVLGFVAPPAGATPLLAGIATAVVCVVAFALPPVATLAGVSPLRVFRRDFAVQTLSLGASVSIGVAGIAGLMWWYARDFWLAMAVMAGLLAMLAVSMLLVVQLFRRVRTVGMQAGSATGLALAALYRRNSSNAFQTVSFALALMVLFCLVVVRGTLLEDWQRQLPEDAPNHFLINIHPDQVDSMRTLFASRNIEDAGLYPMVRGRLTAIDGQPLEAIANVDASDPSVNREMNLSWSENLPDDNQLLRGSWWGDEAAASQPVPVSVESEFAERLGLDIGSTLHFSIGGYPLQAVVQSFRELRWESMRPNFFLLFPPGVLENYPATYITSFYLPPGQKALLNEFVQRYPTVTLIEMDVVIRQIQTVVQQVTAAMELVLALIIACALLVTVANVQASVDHRLHENAVLRTLGAPRKLIAGSLLLEFLALGTLAGVLAAAGGELSLYLLESRLLQIETGVHWQLWLLSPPTGALLIALAGWLSCRRVVNTPPLQVLRQL